MSNYYYYSNVFNEVSSYWNLIVQIQDFNVLFVDNPVGTGFSYVTELELLTTTNDEIGKWFFLSILMCLCNM